MCGAVGGVHGLYGGGAAGEVALLRGDHAVLQDVCSSGQSGEEEVCGGIADGFVVGDAVLVFGGGQDAGRLEGGRTHIFEVDVYVNDQQEIITTQQAEILQLQTENVQQQAEIGVLQQIAFVQEMDLQKLQNTVNKMQELLKSFCGRSGGVNPEPNCCESLLHRDNNSPQDTNNNNNLIKQIPILYQNTPNPFSANTEISCDIPTAFNSAFIYIYNLQGIELMSFPIVQTGYSTVAK